MVPGVGGRPVSNRLTILAIVLVPSLICVPVLLIRYLLGM